MSNAWGSSFGQVWNGAWGANLQAQAATGPGVVLFPHQPIRFRTRGDFALFALAGFAKQEALRVRERHAPLIEIRRVAIHV